MIRPGAAAWLRRWRGVALAAGLGVGAAFLLAPAALRGAPLAILLLALVLPVAALFARDALIRARLRPLPGPGVVTVREGAVVHFGPESGGAASLDSITALALTTTPEGPVWRIASTEGDLDIAAGARGAGALPDAFAALPGFDPGRLAAALRRPPGETTEVWRRVPRLRLGRR